MWLLTVTFFILAPTADQPIGPGLVPSRGAPKNVPAPFSFTERTPSAAAARITLESLFQTDMRGGR